MLLVYAITGFLHGVLHNFKYFIRFALVHSDVCVDQKKFPWDVVHEDFLTEIVSRQGIDE